MLQQNNLSKDPLYTRSKCKEPKKNVGDVGETGPIGPVDLHIGDTGPVDLHIGDTGPIAVKSDVVFLQDDDFQAGCPRVSIDDIMFKEDDDVEFGNPRCSEGGIY